MGNSSLRIDEIDDSKKSDSDPHIYFKGTGLSVLWHDEARLECPVFGHPRPVVTWKKNGVEIVF
jgi:hypothetical protein